MQNYKESLHYNFFVGSGSVLTDTTKSTADLAPLQIGLFNTKNYKLIAPTTSTSKVYEIGIAMGSPNQAKINWENANVSFKSVPIQANRLISWRKALPKKALNHIVTIGWDGVTDCKTITAECGKTYSLHVEVQGSPAVRYFGAKPLTQRFVYTFADCGDDCTADVEKMVDSFVLQINSDKQISPFVQAEKIVNYTVDPSVTTVDYDRFTLTIADEGSLQNLTSVQAAYPNAISVVRISRSGILSTYELIQLGSLPDPADFSTSNITTIANCSTCPSGYTLVPKFYKFKVERTDAGTAGNLATIATDYPDGSSAVAPVRLSYENGTSTYIVHKSTASTPSAAATGDIVTPIGSTEPYCTLTSPTTVAWVQGTGLYRVTRDLCMVIGDQPCDDPETDAAQIAALTAYYAGNTSIVSGSLAQVSSGTCANSYTLTQYSDLLEDGCGIDVATFPKVDPYQGFHWTVCPCVTTTPNQIDNIGIRLTGAYVDTTFGNCSFMYDDYVELDLPKIIVRQGESIVEVGECNDTWDVTTIQFPQYHIGNGTNVKKQYIEYMVFKHQRWNDSPRWREIFGYNYDFIDTSKYYKFFYLEFEAIDKYNKNTGYGGMDIRTTVTFAFPEDTNTTAFENLLESWINSARPDLIDADYRDSLYR